MKRSLPIALSLSMILGMAATAASASNTITIEGGVTATTCQVAGGQGLVPGTPTANFIVKLPILPKTVFTGAGVTAATTPFTIKLSNCTAGADVAAYFHAPAADIDMASGTLLNQANSTGTETNIRIQLLDGQNSDAAIDLRAYNPAALTHKAIDTTTNSVDLVYAAQYYAASANVTAGAYSSDLQYDIDYQ